MADIGKLAVAVVANPAGFSAGLKQAEQRLGTFASNVQGTFASIQGMNLSGAFGGITNALGSMGSIAAAASNPVTLFAGAAAFAATGLHSMAAAGERSIKEASRFAARFGMTTEAASGLGLAARYAGTNLEELTHPIQHLARHLGQAAAGSVEADRAFRALGLSGSDLAELPIDDAMGRILDRLRMMPNANERAAASFRLFGRSGQEMERMISGGSAALRRAGEDARRLGIEVTPAAAASISASVNAGRRMAAVTGSVGTSLAQGAAVAFAPASTEFSNMLTGLVFDLQPVFELLKGGFNLLGEAAHAATSLLGGLASGLGQAISALGDRTWGGLFPGGNEDNRSLLTVVSEALGDRTWGGLFPGANYTRPGGGANLPGDLHAGIQSAAQIAQNQAADQAFNTQVESLNRLVNTFGMSQSQIAAYDAQLHGLSEAQTGVVVYLAQELELRQQEVEVMREFAALATPMETFAAGVNDLTIRFGLGIISEEQYARGLTDAARRAEGALGGLGVRFAGAAEAGGREAYATELRARFAGPENQQERIAALIAAGNEQQAAQLQVMRDVLAALGNQAAVVGGF